MYKTPSNLLDSTIYVDVIGVGGTGAYLLSLLAQMNFILINVSEGRTKLHVTAFDDDVVSEFSVGRQNFYPQDLGINKAEVIINRINLGFGTQWEYRNERYDSKVVRNKDVLMTCVDNISSRIEIGKLNCKKKSECLWIDGGNDSTSGNVIFGHLGQPENQIKIPNWFDLYYETMKNLKDDNRDSCSHSDSINRQGFGVNHQTALFMSQFLWKMLRYGEVNIGAQFFDLKEGDSKALEINSNVWESFGYTEHLKKH